MSGAASRDGLIDSWQVLLMQSEEGDVLEGMKEAYAEEWIGMSELFAKFFHCAVAMGFDAAWIPH